MSYWNTTVFSFTSPVRTYGAPSGFVQLPVSAEPVRMRVQTVFTGFPETSPVIAHLPGIESAAGAVERAETSESMRSMGFSIGVWREPSDNLPCLHHHRGIASRTFIVSTSTMSPAERPTWTRYAPLGIVHCCAALSHTPKGWFAA